MFPADGWVTARAKAVATAASTALPPRVSTRAPISDAKLDADTTIPRRDATDPAPANEVRADWLGGACAAKGDSASALAHPADKTATRAATVIASRCTPWREVVLAPRQSRSTMKLDICARYYRLDRAATRRAVRCGRAVRVDRADAALAERFALRRFALRRFGASALRRFGASALQAAAMRSANTTVTRRDRVRAIGHRIERESLPQACFVPSWKCASLACSQSQAASGWCCRQR